MTASRAASTLPAGPRRRSLPRLARSTWPSVPVGATAPRRGVRALTAVGWCIEPAGTPRGGAAPAPSGRWSSLRSRTERLALPANPLPALGVIDRSSPCCVATLLSYAVARTVTRPLGAITATMREMAATGDLTRRIALRRRRAWEDEDARLLATTFNTMTDSIARFQREAAQRERLSSLGRLSTVVAHEIRNPLMIIKTRCGAAPRTDVTPEELARRRRRHRRRDRAPEPAGHRGARLRPADQVRPGAGRSQRALRRRRAGGAAADAAAAAIRLELDPSLPPVVTDAERLRLALVNILTNARDAVRAPIAGAAATAPPRRSGCAPGSRRRPAASPSRCRDRARALHARIWRASSIPTSPPGGRGTGLGLAISRNIIEGLGGTIAVASRPGAARSIRIELPRSGALPFDSQPLRRGRLTAVDCS